MKKTYEAPIVEKESISIIDVLLGSTGWLPYV